jgi:hypothetical protein
MSDLMKRPTDSNADAWALFLSEWLHTANGRVLGISYVAVQIAEALDEGKQGSNGMARRDYFAGQALVGLMAKDGYALPERLAFHAYNVADAMLAVDTALRERIAELEAERDAIRADERERCAKVAEPKGPRPCDCDRCYCGNPGDTEAVAVWDTEDFIARSIRASGEKP